MPLSVIAWDRERTDPFPSDAIYLGLDGFEGPLDLLLELARRQRVDLARFSIMTLVDHYLLAVSDVPRFDLIQVADWQSPEVGSGLFRPHAFKDEADAQMHGRLI